MDAPRARVPFLEHSTLQNLPTDALTNIAAQLPPLTLFKLGATCVRFRAFLRSAPGVWRASCTTAAPFFDFSRSVQVMPPTVPPEFVRAREEAERRGERGGLEEKYRGFPRLVKDFLKEDDPTWFEEWCQFFGGGKREFCGAPERISAEQWMTLWRQFWFGEIAAVAQTYTVRTFEVGDKIIVPHVVDAIIWRIL
mmetsp:Transcript_10528/g.26403  ORF Transcript_10528/g.26403 Transcript_10528/m.26403 type:complete len:195 (+) Transcript_10528:54-638(+)